MTADPRQQARAAVALMLEAQKDMSPEETREMFERLERKLEEAGPVARAYFLGVIDAMTERLLDDMTASLRIA